MAPIAGLLLGLSVAIASPLVADNSGTARIPLQQHQPAVRGAVSVAKQAVHAVLKRAKGVATVPETLDGGFWYGNFTVGGATSLSLLIDTGSSDAAVNPDLYKPTKSSVNLHKSGHLAYDTVYENGCGVADIAYNVYNDSMSFGGLTSPKQSFANVVATTPPNNGTITQFPHDGLVGFGSIDDSELPATPFFTNLCQQGVVKQCRFGLAYKTDGTGEQILGEVATNLYTGALTTSPSTADWFLQGDVVVGGTVIAKNQQILLDSGTANVIGPPAMIQKLFKAAGIQGVNLTLPGCTEVLTGYYPCAKPPANVGFVFPTGGKTAFDIEPPAFQEADDGNGNCTAIVAGIDFGGIWIIGQAWFQGKYVDFNNVKAASPTVGIAQLKSK